LNLPTFIITALTLALTLTLSLAVAVFAVGRPFGTKSRTILIAPPSARALSRQSPSSHFCVRRHGGHARHPGRRLADAGSGQRAGDRSTAHDANEQQRGVTASDGECESAAGAWTSRTGCALDARGTRRRAGMQRVDQIHSCSCLYRPGTQTLDDAWHASSSSSASLSCSLLCLVLPARLGFSSLPATALLCSARCCLPLGRPLSGMTAAAVAVPTTSAPSV
jgi:hypothetical protein